MIAVFAGYVAAAVALAYAAGRSARRVDRVILAVSSFLLLVAAALTFVGYLL